MVGLVDYDRQKIQKCTSSMLHGQGAFRDTLARWEDYSTSMIWISGLVQFRPFLGNTDGRVADSPVSAPVAASLQEIPLARLPTESLVVWPQPLVV